MRTARLGARSLPSWRLALRCEGMCRIGWPGWCGRQTELQFADRWYRGRGAGTDGGNIGGGLARGARRRSLIDSLSTSLATKPCASVMKQSTKHFTCKAVALFVVNSRPSCEQGEHYEFRGPAPEVVENRLSHPSCLSVSGPLQSLIARCRVTGREISSWG